MTDKRITKPQEPPKPTAKLSINCGCGFKAKDSKDASAHVTETGHVMSVHGLLGMPVALSGMRLR